MDLLTETFIVHVIWMMDPTAVGKVMMTINTASTDHSGGGCTATSEAFDQQFHRKTHRFLSIQRSRLSRLDPESDQRESIEVTTFGDIDRSLVECDCTSAKANRSI